MIDKSIRQHYDSGMLVKKRADGKRPGYAWDPGAGAPQATASSSGSVGGEYAGRHPPVHVAPPPPTAARVEPARVEPKVSPIQSMAMTGGTGLAGMTQTQAANVMKASEAVNRDQTGGTTLLESDINLPDIPVTTGEGMIPGPIQGVISQPNIPITRGGGADVIPEFVPRKTTTVTGGIPHREDPIQKIVYEPREGPARTYDPRTDPNALLDRGSGILGTAKDKATQMAKNLAKQKAMKALGLGALNPFLGVGSWLLDKFAPGAKAKFTSKFKAPGTGTQKLVSGDTRDGENVNIQAAITGDKGLLTEGAETLGITEDQRKQYLLMQNKMKTALDQGSYINAQGQVIQLNEQQMDQLQKYIDNLNNILQTTLQTAAHGGRIDGPLTGGSRYI